MYSAYRFQTSNKVQLIIAFNGLRFCHNMVEKLERHQIVSDIQTKDFLNV